MCSTVYYLEVIKIKNFDGCMPSFFMQLGGVWETQSMRYHTRAKRRKEAAMDWRAIKTEYVTTDTSYRKLAKKYGIHHTAIAIRAGREGWVAERERFNNKTLSKTLNKLSSEQAGRAARLHRVADKLLSKIEKAVDALEDEALETQQYRQLTASLKDLKDIQMIKSEADIREQEARIANLKRQAEKEDEGTKEVRVVFGEGEEKEWAE